MNKYQEAKIGFEKQNCIMFDTIKLEHRLQSVSLYLSNKFCEIERSCGRGSGGSRGKPPFIAQNSQWLSMAPLSQWYKNQECNFRKGLKPLIVKQQSCSSTFIFKTITFAYLIHLLLHVLPARLTADLKLTWCVSKSLKFLAILSQNESEFNYGLNGLEKIF